MTELRRRLTPKGALWRHPDFLKLWTGQSISELGSQVSQLAIPWVAAVVLHVTPFVFSLLGMLGFLPFIIFALPAGVGPIGCAVDRSSSSATPDARCYSPRFPLRTRSTRSRSGSCWRCSSSSGSSPCSSTSRTSRTFRRSSSASI